jgi:hypothetical protein
MIGHAATRRLIGQILVDRVALVWRNQPPKKVEADSGSAVG